jgi:hypothetical protein
MRWRNNLRKVALFFFQKSGYSENAETGCLVINSRAAGFEGSGTLLSKISEAPQDNQRG